MDYKGDILPFLSYTILGSDNMARPKKEKGECCVDGCNRVEHCRGYCERHYTQIKRYGKITKVEDDWGKRECKVNGCNGKHYGNGYCEKHWWQVRRYGDTLERTQRDKNEIVIIEDVAYIVLYNKDSEEVARTVIDKNNVDVVKNYKWCLDNDGYVVTTINNKTIHLHRFLLNCDDTDKVVDHIDGNPLNNKKSNLRIVTQKENRMNNSLKGLGTNKRVGVVYCKREKKWRATIQKDYKVYYLGYFHTEEEAIKAREEAEIKYFGEYRRKDE